jgi:antirestriction protein
VFGKSDKENIMQTTATYQTAPLALPDGMFRIFAWNKYIDDPRESMKTFDNCNVNIAENLEDWAQRFGVKSGLLNEFPEDVRPYFNYAGWARDALQNGDIWVLELFEGNIAVFYKREV